MDRLTLIRHGEIHGRWKGCCYGAADIGLSPKGLTDSRRIADLWVGTAIDHLYSSDLRRAAYLAELLGQAAGCDVHWTSELRERDFGDWEKQPWDDIYRATGDAMDGMITAPDRWRPPAGETTFELRDRILRWYRALPEGRIVAVTHGGPIAALVGSLRGEPVERWPSLTPGYGERVDLPGARDDRP